VRRGGLLISCALLLLLSLASNAEPPGMERMQHAYGQWSGALQYVLFTLDRELAGQGQTATTRLSIAPSGAFSAVAEGIGCRLTGQITRGWLFARADIEVNLRGCHQPIFNTHFSGYIYANDRRKNALIRLESKATDTQGYPMTIYVTGKLDKLAAPD
jgi:hypothetical protein